MVGTLSSRNGTEGGTEMVEEAKLQKAEEAGSRGA